MTNARPYVNLWDITFSFNGAYSWAAQEQQLLASFTKKDGSLATLRFNVYEGKVRDVYNNIIDIGYSTFRYPNGTLGIRADILSIANVMGYSDRITISALPDGSKVYSIDATSAQLYQNTKYANITSIGISFIPGIGTVKDWQEVVTGYDIISGESIAPGDRVITVICAFVPGVSGAAGRVVKTGFAKTDNAIASAEKLNDIGTANQVRAVEAVAGAIEMSVQATKNASSRMVVLGKYEGEVATSYQNILAGIKLRI